jgi:hypothetical protein
VRVIIAGSRYINDYGLVKEAIRRSGFQIDEVVCGGTQGVDALGARWAAENGVPVKLFKAQWRRLSRRAGLVRNLQMATYADALIAVWNGTDRGTFHLIRVMEDAGKPVLVLKFDAQANVWRVQRGGGGSAAAEGRKAAQR